MSKKLTYDYVKNKFSERKYILLSKEYNNAFEKLIYQDIDGYLYYQSYNGFERNATSEKFHKSNPYTIQNIKLWCRLNNKPFELISDKYIGNNKNLKWKCFKCEEFFESKWNDILQGKGCGRCAKNRKLSYQEVRNYIEFESKSGCILLSTEYFNVYEKLKLKCKCGNEFYVNFSDFKHGNKQQCNECGFLMIADSRRNDYTYIKNFIEVESNSGCKLLSKNYINNTTLLHIQCKCGNKFYDTFAHFRQFNSSKACETCSNKIKWDIFKMQKWCDENAKGYRILEVFKKETKVNNLYIKIKCPNQLHKPYVVSWNNFYSKNKRCKKCYLENNVGENHPNWQGGITPLHNFLRSNIDQWKVDSMKNSGYKCVITGNDFNNIHHLYNFNKILKQTLKETNLSLYENISLYTQEELQQLIDKCIEIHYRYPLGVCLSSEIHTLFHSLYGILDNTPEQFDEFKQRYCNGEFELKEASNL